MFAFASFTNVYTTLIVTYALHSLWMDRWMDRWIDGCVGTGMHGWVGEWTDRTKR